MSLTLFCAGFAIPFCLFLFDAARSNGIGIVPLLGRSAFRGLVISTATLLYYGVFSIVFMSLVLSLPLLFGDFSGMNSSMAWEDFVGFGSILLVVVVLALVPICLVFMAREAARFKIYIQSSINIYASAIILAMFFSGMWLTFGADLEVVVYLAIISLFLLSSFATRIPEDSARVTGLERWTLVAMFFITSYVSLTNVEVSAATLFIIGYAVASLLIRFFVLFLPQHESYTQKSPTLSTASPNELAPRVAVFFAVGVAISANYAFNFLSMPALVMALLAVADLISLRMKHGFASIRIDWKVRERATIPTLWSTIKLRGVR